MMRFVCALSQVFLRPSLIPGHPRLTLIANPPSTVATARPNRLLYS